MKGWCSAATGQMAILARLCRPLSPSFYVPAALLTALGVLWLRFCTRSWLRLRWSKLCMGSGNDMGRSESSPAVAPEPPELLAEQLSRSTYFLGEDGQAKEMLPASEANKNGP